MPSTFLASLLAFCNFLSLRFMLPVIGAFDGFEPRQPHESSADFISPSRTGDGGNAAIWVPFFLREQCGRLQELGRLRLLAGIWSQVSGGCSCPAERLRLHISLRSDLLLFKTLVVGFLAPLAEESGEQSRFHSWKKMMWHYRPLKFRQQTFQGNFFCFLPYIYCSSGCSY